MDAKKLHLDTNDKLLVALNTLVKSHSASEKERYQNPEKTLRTFAAYFDDILTTASCSAVLSYHNQLRKTLKDQYNIDIGELE